MATKKKPVRRGGARRKAPGGLTHALFIRADKPLIDALERIRLDRMATSRGISLSLADVARSILWAAIEAEERAQE